jgi:LPXTG-motif cell wall-anchored protein
LEYADGTKIVISYGDGVYDEEIVIFDGPDSQDWTEGGYEYKKTVQTISPDGTVTDGAKITYVYGAKSLNGSPINPSSIYDVVSAGTITTDVGTITYSLNADKPDGYVDDSGQTVPEYISDSTFTDNKTGKSEHSLRVLGNDLSGAMNALKDGSAFVVNPYPDQQTVVTDPKTYLPNTSFEEVFKLGKGTLVADFTEGDGWGAGGYSYFVDNDGLIYGLGVWGGDGLHNSQYDNVVTGIADGSAFEINPYNPQYGGIISVTSTFFDNGNTLSTSGSESDTNSEQNDIDSDNGKKGTNTQGKTVKPGEITTDPKNDFHSVKLTHKDENNASVSAVIPANSTSDKYKPDSAASYPQTADDNSLVASFAGVMAVAMASVLAMFGLKRRNN